MTPQARYILLNRAEGKCVSCGKKTKYRFCKVHRKAAAAKQRRLRESKKRVYRAVEGAGL